MCFFLFSVFSGFQFFGSTNLLYSQPMDIPLLFMELDMSSDRMGEVPLRMGKCVPLAKFWSTTFLPFHLPSFHFLRRAAWRLHSRGTCHEKAIARELNLQLIIRKVGCVLKNFRWSLIRISFLAANQ